MTEQKSIMKHTTAWLPLFMSLIALLLVVFYIAFVGIPDQSAKDEGTPARIFQLLLAGQLPVIAIFAFKYLRKNPGGSLLVIATQLFAAVVPVAIIYFLEM